MIPAYDSSMAPAPVYNDPQAQVAHALMMRYAQQASTPGKLIPPKPGMFPGMGHPFGGASSGLSSSEGMGAFGGMGEDAGIGGAAGADEVAGLMSAASAFA